VNYYTIYDSRAGRPPLSVSTRLRVCYIVRTDRYDWYDAPGAGPQPTDSVLENTGGNELGTRKTYETKNAREEKGGKCGTENIIIIILQSRIGPVCVCVRAWRKKRSAAGGRGTRSSREDAAAAVFISLSAAAPAVVDHFSFLLFVFLRDITLTIVTVNRLYTQTLNDK